MKIDGTFYNYMTVGTVTQETKTRIFPKSTFLYLELFWLRPYWVVEEWAGQVGGGGWRPYVLR